MWIGWFVLDAILLQMIYISYSLLHTVLTLFICYTAIALLFDIELLPDFLERRKTGFEESFVFWMTAIIVSDFLYIATELNAYGVFWMLSAWFLADFITGFVHFVGDTWELGNFPEHHKSPLRMTERTYAGRSWDIASVVYILRLLTEPSFFTTMLLFGCLISNEMHAWAHINTSSKPTWVKVLQKYHIILNPKFHNSHHIKPHLINFNVLNGWSAGVLNPVSRMLHPLLLSVRGRFRERSVTGRGSS